MSRDKIIVKIKIESIDKQYFLISNLIKYKKVKISKFGTFTVRNKKSRIGRNPKTLEKKIITERNVILFKASKELKDFINKKDD